jgi:hypothetical protein
VSGKGINRGDSGAAENSVGGVDDLELGDSDEAFEVEEIAGTIFSGWISQPYSQYNRL